MDNVLKFPDRTPKEDRSYRIPLYTDYDVELVLFCVNAFGETEKRVTIDNLIEMDAIEVKKCIDFAVKSGYISNTIRADLTVILNSIEEIIL
jgi:hypothetical protein